MGRWSHGPSSKGKKYKVQTPEQPPTRSRAQKAPRLQVPYKYSGHVLFILKVNSILVSVSVGINYKYLYRATAYLVKYLIIDSCSHLVPFTLVPQCRASASPFSLTEFPVMWISLTADNWSRISWSAIFKWDVEGRAREGGRTFQIDYWNYHHDKGSHR